MTLGTMALVLIRLESLPGQAFSVTALAMHYGLHEGLVRESLQALWDEDYVRCELGADGLIHAATATGKGR